MNIDEMRERTQDLAKQMDVIKNEMAAINKHAIEQVQMLLSAQHVAMATPDFIVNALTVLVLAGFVGYYVIWNVTPALYAPLMAVSNAISSVMVVGAMIAAGTSGSNFAAWMGFFAVVLASVNFFGGWVISDRMLTMFKKKKKEA